MIPFFELTEKQTEELNQKIRDLGSVHPFHDSGKIMSVIMRFHEDIHINLLMNGIDDN